MVLTMLERGGVYLANLNPNKGNEPGKVRPVAVIQSNALNEIEHPTIIILPLSTQLINQSFPLRFRLKARDELRQDSDILCDQIRAITGHRIASKKLTQLSIAELLQVEEQIRIVLDFS
jgi:mRNA interferase MazF